MYRVTLHKIRYSALASSNFQRRRETRLVTGQTGVTVFEKKLYFTHMAISFSGFIYFTCVIIPFGSDQFFTPQDIFYRYNFTHTSPILVIMFHKSTPALIFPRFTFIQIQVFFIFFSQFHQIQHNFNRHTLRTTGGGHHIIIFHTTPFE